MFVIATIILVTLMVMIAFVIIGEVIRAALSKPTKRKRTYYARVASVRGR